VQPNCELPPFSGDHTSHETPARRSNVCNRMTLCRTVNQILTTELLKPADEVSGFRPSDGVILNLKSKQALPPLATIQPNETPLGEMRCETVRTTAGRETSPDE
jgi:hypothetical protein